MQTITVEDEVYETLQELAQQRGQSTDLYLKDLIAKQNKFSPVPTGDTPADIQERLKRLENLKTLIRPVSGHVDYSRDAIYP